MRTVIAVLRSRVCAARAYAVHVMSDVRKYVQEIRVYARIMFRHVMHCYLDLDPL